MSVMNKNTADGLYIREIELDFLNNIRLLRSKVAQWVQYQGCEDNQFGGVEFIFKSSQHSIYFKVKYRGEHNADYFNGYYTEIYSHFRALKYEELEKNSNQLIK